MAQTILDTNSELEGSYAEDGTSVGYGVIRLTGQGSQTGKHYVYVTRAELRTMVSVPTGNEDTLDLMCIMATRWVLYKVGELVLADDVAAMPPYELEEIQTTPGRKQAARVAASRFWSGPSAAHGVIGGLGEEAVYTSMRISEAEIALIGQRVAFPVA